MFFKKRKIKDNYKVKELKTFSSIEYLFFNKKKYRKVFDEKESRYIYCELSFHNKLFDVSDWNANVKLICQNVDTEVRICKLNKKLKVSKDENIIFVREGWGTSEPGWWKEGKYSWRVFIDDIKVGETIFYITNVGLVTPTENPYFSIKKTLLFESPQNTIPLRERVYVNKFEEKKTKYINLEMSLISNLTTKAMFPLELQFNFYNEIGQLKAYAEYFNENRDRKRSIVLDAGYGSQDGLFWYKGYYTINVFFMDQLIAVVPFKVGDEMIE
jgi:hypothetical protein